MTYIYLFDIAALFILGLVSYDYHVKMRVYRSDAVLFRLVLISSIGECIVDLLSSILIEHTARVPVEINIFVAALYFVLQATMIYCLALFSFLYMNPDLKWKQPAFGIITLLYFINLFLAIATPFTKWYFYFDSSKSYRQGNLADVGYYFFYINVFACIAYALYNRVHILKKDLLVAGWVAFLVCGSVTIQFLHRDVLLIGFGMAMAILYVYLTLENPNDYQDKLTHCTNSYGFKIFVDGKVGVKKPFAVLFLDICKFHYINEIYGNENSDFLLQQVVLFLEKHLKQSLVFRLNDDVFAITFAGTKEAAAAADKILRRFEQSWTLPGGEKAAMQAVMIVCEYPRYFDNHTELLELRNFMMKEIKGNHHERVLYANQKTADQYRRQEKVEQALRKALEGHTLQVYYQPIFDSHTEEITAAEALSRLQDDKLGMIPPDEFIAVAERTGLIISLGFYVLEEVCSFVEHTVIPDEANTITCIHVNMSMLQCAYPASNEKYFMIMRRHHVPPQMIHFELTESSMTDSPDLVHETMNTLNGAGVHFSLDDYGTGFSNISYLI